MGKGLVQEKGINISELAEVLLLDDEIELENDIREWLQTPSIQLKEYGLGEADGGEEYYALLNELSELLMER